MTSTIKKALTTETLTGTTSTTTYDGYYYANIITDTSNIISAIVEDFSSYQSAFCQIMDFQTLRVWAKVANTNISVRVTRA